MTFGIIIKNNSQKFKPHFNREFCDKANPNGKMVWTSEDYRKELKERNLVPYFKPKEKAEPKLKPSKWAHEMVEAVKRSKGKPGSAFYDQLAKKGYDINKMAALKDKAKKTHETGKNGFSE